MISVFIFFLFLTAKTLQLLLYISHTLFSEKLVCSTLIYFHTAGSLTEVAWAFIVITRFLALPSVQTKIALKVN